MLLSALEQSLRYRGVKNPSEELGLFQQPPNPVVSNVGD